MYPEINSSDLLSTQEKIKAREMELCKVLERVERAKIKLQKLHDAVQFREQENKEVQNEVADTSASSTTNVTDNLMMKTEENCSKNCDMISVPQVSSEVPKLCLLPMPLLPPGSKLLLKVPVPLDNILMKKLIAIESENQQLQSKCDSMSKKLITCEQKNNTLKDENDRFRERLLQLSESTGYKCVHCCALFSIREHRDLHARTCTSQRLRILSPRKNLRVLTNSDQITPKYTDLSKCHPILADKRIK